MTQPASPLMLSRPFVPRRWLTNGHVMTVYTWARPRVFPALPPVDTRFVRVSPDTQVRADCFWQPDRAGKPTLLALHGLEGSSDAHYMRGLADKAFRRGWNAVLLNQRNCGGTEHLTPGLYHSGLTDDPRAVIRTLVASERLGPVGVVGYSLGGNLTIKLAGELLDTPDVPVAGVVAVSPTIDLDLCVRALERRANVVYHWNFLRHLKARMRRKNAAWPGAFDVSRLDAIRSIRAFDDAYTAPYHGYHGASDYYHRASALRVVDRIAVPALIITADDDPFVPGTQFADPAAAGNARLTIWHLPHGGHCGFAGDPGPADDGYWAEQTAIEFLASVMPR